MLRRCLILSAVLMLGLLCRQANAQVLYGSIVGNVTDQSGAGVPDAKVTITQLETNQSRDTVTNDAGGYSFTNVLAGTYTVIVSKPGFQSFTAQNILVQLNSVVRVNAPMAVGAVSQSVNVTAEAAVLQTDRADVHADTTTQQLENLPVTGRSFQSLLFDTPGVTQPIYFQTGGINNPSRSMEFDVNGTPTGEMIVRVDGITATNLWIGGLQAYTPSIEAIQTVNTVTNSSDAEQGLAGAATVSVQIKSGTNELHGSAFEYVTNSDLRARGYFLPANVGKLQDDKNVFGGTVGGPIKKNKLFYFASVESTVERAQGAGPYATQNGPTSNFLTLPQAAIRTGDFSSTGTTIYDPTTGNANGTGRTPFPNDMIPASRLSPITQNMLSYLPLPQNSLSAYNYFAIPKYDTNWTKLDSKINWNPSDKLTIYGRFSYLPDSETTSGYYPGAAGSNPLSLGTVSSASVLSTSVGGTYIVRPNFLVDGVVGFTRQHTQQHPPGAQQCWGEVLGIANACQPPGQRDIALPVFNLSNATCGQFCTGLWTGYGNTVNTSSVFDYLDPQYDYVVNAGWTKGSHNLRFGFEVLRMDFNHYEITAPSFTFTGGLTALNGGAVPNQYNSFGDFLLGLPQSLTDDTDTPPLNSGANAARPATLRDWTFALYARDQWQVNRKLTVSAGLRWEYYPVPTRADRGIEIFDFTTDKVTICGIAGNPGDCGVHVNPLQFAPRFGIAYRPWETFVIRTGFALNWEQDNMYRAGLYAYPTTIPITQAGANSYSAEGNLSAGDPIFPTPNVASGSVPLLAGAGTTTLPMNYVRGYIMSWNFTVQKSLGHNFVLTSGYVGNRAVHQVQSQNINYGQIGGGTASQPYFQTLGITAAISDLLPMARTSYDSLQTTLTRRFTSGLTVSASETWSKAISNFAGTIPIPQYFKLNKGVTSFNIPQHFTLASTYELPFGKGKQFLNSSSRMVSALAGGWQVSGVFSVISGTPFTITASTASLNAPGSPQTANQVVKNVQILGGDDPYFNPLDFASVTCACFGTAGYNTIRGPGIIDLDASVFRNFRLGERFALQFRAEGFNVTNTPHLANPSGTNVGAMQLNSNGTVANLNGFGVITSTNNSGRDFDERYLRLGLRLSW